MFATLNLDVNSCTNLHLISGYYIYQIGIDLFLKDCYIKNNRVQGMLNVCTILCMEHKVLLTPLFFMYHKILMSRRWDYFKVTDLQVFL